MKRSIIKYSAFLAAVTSIMLFAFNASDNIEDRNKISQADTEEKIIPGTIEENKSDTTQTSKYTKSGLLVD